MFLVCHLLGIFVLLNQDIVHAEIAETRRLRPACSYDIARLPALKVMLRVHDTSILCRISASLVRTPGRQKGIKPSALITLQ